MTFPEIAGWKWVTGKIIVDTDSLDIMRIPDKLINLYYSISDSFVGYDSGEFIYKNSRLN